MALDPFSAAVAFVLTNEGGSRFTNAPLDHGGPTKYGVTLLTLQDYRGRICTGADVQAMQEDEARAIYRTRYWHPMGLDASPGIPVGMAALDGAVLCGVGTASRILQRHLGVPDDGVMGPVSQAALRRADVAPTVAAMEAGLRTYLVGIVQRDPSQKVWLTGWLCRLAKMATLTVAGPPV